MLRLLTACIAVASILGTDFAHAQTKWALVIGNDAYLNVDRLQKATNDARALAAALQRVGFTATLGQNLARRDFVRTIAEFESRLRPGDTALIFYAGHGVEIEGANYLMPVDIPKVAPGQQGILKDEAVSTDGLIQRIKARGTRSQILILDACRENPFRDVQGRSVGATRGLGPSLPSNGVFILYSAGIGEVALDRLSNADSDPNSVFTRTLIPLIENPNLSLVKVAKEARARVKSLAESIGHRQSPAYYDEIDGDLFLARLAEPSPSPRDTTAQQGGRIKPSPSPAPLSGPQAAADPTHQPVARADPSTSSGAPLPSPTSGFLFPDSDRRYLSAQEVSRLSLAARRLARNEIYARRGRFFRDPRLRAHFARQPWYRPHSWEVSLNPIEQANVNLIQSMER